jgi:hypothetical protein
VGGVFNAGFLILKPFEKTVRKGIPGAVIKPPVDPIRGALILGMKENGLRITSAVLNRIDIELKKWVIC